MKRSSSATSTSSEDPHSTTPPITPPPSKKVKTEPTSPKSSSNKKAKTPRTPKTLGGAPNGTWTPEKRGVFMDEIMAARYKSADLDGIAARLELSKRQLIDQLVPNKSNLRARAVKAVKGE